MHRHRFRGRDNVNTLVLRGCYVEARANRQRLCQSRDGERMRKRRQVIAWKVIHGG